MTEIFDEYGNYIYPTDVTDIRTDVTSIPRDSLTNYEPSATIHFREPTKEERDSVKAYVKSISQNTGISFYDFVKGA